MEQNHRNHPNKSWFINAYDSEQHKKKETSQQKLEKNNSNRHILLSQRSHHLPVVEVLSWSPHLSQMVKKHRMAV